MSRESKSLISALAERDRLKGYLSSLDRLSADGEVTGEQEALARTDYEQRIARSDAEIGALKSDLRRQLSNLQRDIDVLHTEKGRMQARYKVGEITLSKYQGEEKKLQSQVTTLERERDALTALLDAQTAEGLDAAKTIVHAPEPQRPQPGGGRLRSRMTDPTPGPIIPGSPLRIAAVVIAALLLLSIRLPWLGASELLGTDLPTEAGVSVSFLAGLAGVICGLGGVAAGFLRRPAARGLIHAGLGLLAIAALAGAVFLRELPLHDSYFMELVSLRGGFFLYIAAAITLAVLGLAERRAAG